MDAFLEGIKLFFNLGFDNVEVEGDSKIIVKILHNKSEEYSWYLVEVSIVFSHMHPHKTSHIGGGEGRARKHTHHATNKPLC